MNAAIEVEGVTKRFAGTLALDDVSFSVGRATSWPSWARTAPGRPP